VPYIQGFVKSVFGEGENRTPQQWPELEDIFTLVDLAANTGHHLGPNHSASDLRIVRRAIIVRMIRMLSKAYMRGCDRRGSEWEMLERFFKRFDVKSSAFLSMNWDTVVEQGIARTQEIDNIEYGCGATKVAFVRGELRPRKTGGKLLTVLKPHGSVNWLYCDACREMFWVAPHQVEQVAQTLFGERDWSRVGPTQSPMPKTLEPKCPQCKAKSLGTRFATFSYRKALDFPMHAASWRQAEELLKGAADWVFFGYSMPPADFEFKHLLKRVQLTQRIRPRITVITGGTGAAATVERFTQFFGDVSGERTFFEKGLDDDAMEHLETIGVLKPVPANPKPKSHVKSARSTRR
jgi:NAD-dependent SIR2 family protein deacetylase